MTETFSLEDRQYQINDKARIEKAFEEYQHVLYQLPTGGGKSVVVTGIIEDRKKKNILILAHKRKLLSQMRLQLSYRKISAGFLAGQKEENMNSNIVVVSIRTAVKDARLEKLLKRKWDYCIIDEARHSRTGSYDKVLDALKEAHPQMKILGVDATPYRKDKRRLDKHFQHMIVSEEDVASLTEKGYLQKCKVIVSPIDKENLKEQVKEVANDYQMTALSDYMRQEKYLNYIVDQYKQYGEERQCIVFAVDKAHAHDLRNKFEEKDKYIRVAQIDSDMSVTDIEQVYEDFECSKVQILINIEMATEGVDLPNCGCIIGARPTKSLTLYLQMGGRGTRPDGENDYFILLDCCGWTDEFGTLSSPKHWSLNPEIDPNNPRKKNKIVGIRSDGTYTEDLSEFIGEVIEMDPDEYMSHLLGGLEDAETVNLTIDEKITAIFEELLELIEKILKEDKLSQFEFKIKREYREPQVEITYKKDKDTSTWGKRKVVIPLTNYIYAYVPHESYSTQRNSNAVETYTQLSILAGEFNKKQSENKNLVKQMLEYIESINDLEKSKINLEAFKRAANVFEEEQWEKKIRAYIKEHNKIMFKNKLSEDQHFKGYSYWKIIGLNIPSGQIVNYHNKIELIREREIGWDQDKKKQQSIEPKNYVKGDKVIELIKAGELLEEENKN